MSLESGPLSTPEFAEFSKTVVPFLSVMTRIEGREGDDLLSEYGFRGFPSLAFLDAEGNKIQDQNGRSVSAFKNTAWGLKTMQKVEKMKAEGKTPGPALVLAAELALGKVEFPDAKARFAEMKDVDPELKKKIRGMMIDAEVMHLAGSLERGDEEGMLKVGARFAEMLKAGRAPSGSAEQAFWMILLDYADKKGDAEIFAKALAWVKKTYGDNPGAAEFIQTKEERLTELETEGQPV